MLLIGQYSSAVLVLVDSVFSSAISPQLPCLFALDTYASGFNVQRSDLIYLTLAVSRDYFPSDPRYGVGSPGLKKA
jgi:hypothetical protein